MTICMYEDEQFRQFLPLTFLGPVATLRAGLVPLHERTARHFPKSRTVLAVRDVTAPVTAHTHSQISVNIIKRDENEDVLFVNGRIRAWSDLPLLVSQSRLTTRYVNSSMETVAVLFKAPLVNHTSKITTPAEYLSVYGQEAKDIPDTKTGATLFGHLWDIVSDIDAEILADFAHLAPAGPGNAKVHTGAYLVNPGQTRLCDGVEVLPGAVIDAERGPVYIGANTRVEAHAAIYGPCAIGSNCIVGAGRYRGLSIGHTSRIGGEIEASVFQSYVNKYHAGFIGHSYVGSWVNFGALTTNSDLKNNYSNVRVQSDGASIDTGAIKVGSFIGDHSKFGIGTLLNTGIVIGVGCNIFGGTLISEKEVPSFRWGNSDGWETHEFDKAMETAARTMERRRQKLSDYEKTALKYAFDNSAPTDGCLRFG